ncbi:hypothetical protein B0H19DRAFT_1154987 [Mycena capillaripes]|nr:hypothetical protein B0H19DRAFT_1154987 [Mycena capillaripes]
MHLFTLFVWLTIQFWLSRLLFIGPWMEAYCFAHHSLTDLISDVSCVICHCEGGMGRV